MKSNPRPKASAARFSPAAPLVHAFGLTLALLASACGGGGGGGTNDGSGNPVGAVVQNPATGELFVVEAHQGGSASSFRILETYWGRLVDVYDVDSTSPLFEDFVISDDITNGLDFELTRDPITERDRLTILHQEGTPEFLSALAQIDLNLQVVLKKGFDPSELPPFTAVPRNAALVLRFNDVIEDGGSPVPGTTYPGTVNASTVKLFSGYGVGQGPDDLYEARILPDPNHGDLIGGQFHSTRVIIDLTVSEAEASGTNLPVNSLGLPEAVNGTQPNGLVRIPTHISAAAQQLEILTSLGGRSVAFQGNGPIDPASPTDDVVRAFRSGGKTSVTGDPNNGFLSDGIPPVIIGSQVVSVIQTGPLGGSDGTEFDISFQFQALTCSVKPIAGDVLDFPNHRLQVLQDYLQPPVGGMVGPVHVRLLCDNCVPSTPPVGTNGVFHTTFRGLDISDPPEFGACFVRFSPAATTQPNLGLPVNTTMTVTFSEPMDPTSVQAFDTLTFEYDNNSPSPSGNLLYKNVVGRTVPSQDLREFTFQPITPLRKVQPGGQADRYKFTVLGGVGGITDLAGNPLSVGILPTPFTLTQTGANVDSGGVSLKFNTNDEDGNGAPEIRGQFLYDVVRRLIRARNVSRFSQVADTSVPIVGAMVPFTGPVQTPLSNWGSKMMTVWRYCDLGMGLRDDATHNIDVEGLWWESFSGFIQTDQFAEFQMQITHSKFLPDEALNTGLLPQFPTSGLSNVFDTNVLDKANDPLVVVHPKSKGYTLSPQDTAVSISGNVIVPWPMNRNVTPAEFVYWTWRDTSKIAVGGPDGTGADPQRLASIVGNKNALVGFYTKNNVPTIGLPLLMEFRTYQDSKAGAQNGFQIALAINSSARPFFRSFSTGGVNPNNPAQITIVNPDNSPNAQGGVSQNGNPSPGQDNVFYFGQGDFLVRISRVHTMWFDTLAAGTLFSEPITEPGLNLQPTGTQTLIAFRGASGFTGAGAPTATWNDASIYDAYGDVYTQQQLTALGLNGGLTVTPTFFPQPPPPAPVDKTWKSNITGVNGARYMQARISFVGNALTTLVPELSALGFAFRR